MREIDFDYFNELPDGLTKSALADMINQAENMQIDKLLLKELYALLLNNLEKWFKHKMEEAGIDFTAS